jgi:hypothetical protein
MAGAILVEARVLASVPLDDVQAAFERLLTLGDILLLVGPADDASALPAYGHLHSPVPSTGWPGIATGPGSAVRRQGGRQVDVAAAARLAQIQAGAGATWLIAADDSVATARACTGLGIVCIGPAPDEPDPTRPDHRSHSLLEAARWIETRETFA